MNRRQVLAGSVGLMGGVSSPLGAVPAVASKNPPITGGNAISRPTRLRPGDTVALVAPASVNYDPLYLELAVESLRALGLQVVVGQHVMTRYGYFAGTDEERAFDVNAAFADQKIKAIVCLQGGWGCARILPFLNFDSIAVNPKILLGFSDVTALLNAVHARTGLVTFHGPNGGSAWDEFTVEKVRRLLFDGEMLEMYDAPKRDGTLAARLNRIETINGGRARGRLIGGNLTVLTALMGSPYVPNFSKAILCLEEVGEYIYRCDRMLTTLALAGVLDTVSGVVFGHFTRCDTEPDGLGDFSLLDVFAQHLKQRGIPAFFGARFGHHDEIYTLPLGIEAEMDADKGAIRLLQAAVR